MTGTIGGMDMDSRGKAALVGLIGPRRKVLRLSMQRAADIAGVHRLTWSAWEKGRAQPESYNHAGIDTALQLQPGTVDDLVAGKPFNVPGPPPSPSPLDLAFVTWSEIVAASPKELVEMRKFIEKRRGSDAADEWLEGALEFREAKRAQQAADEQAAQAGTQDLG